MKFFARAGVKYLKVEDGCVDEAYVQGALADAEAHSHSSQSQSQLQLQAGGGAEAQSQSEGRVEHAVAPARSLLASYMRARDRYRVLYPAFGA